MVLYRTNLLPQRYSVLAEAQGFAKLEQQVDLPRRRVALELSSGRQTERDH